MKYTKNEISGSMFTGNITINQSGGQIVAGSGVDYKALHDELLSLQDKPGISDADYRAFSELAKAINKKDDKTISAKIAEFIKSFTGDFFVQFASASLLDFVKSIMGN